MILVEMGTTAGGAMCSQIAVHKRVVQTLMEPPTTADADIAIVDILASSLSRTSTQSVTSGGTPFPSRAQLERVAAETSRVDNSRSIAELRRLSGLTADQLARLFDVSRRAVHHWVSGKVMTAAHEEHLHRVLSVIKRCDRGSASANRRALVEAGASGTSALDLLAAYKYDEAIGCLGGDKEHARRTHKPSATLLAERAPQPPTVLLDKLDDEPVHRSTGVVRAVKNVKVRR